MAEIRVPTLGESVTEATIGRWFKKAGDAVRADEALAELETDKVTLEVNAPAAGVLAEIVAKEGETVGPGALLGQIAEGAAAPAKSGETGGKSAAPKPAPAPAAPAPKSASAPAAPAATTMPPAPAAAKIAVEQGIDVAQVPGSGKRGQALKSDVVQFAARQAAAPQPAQEGRVQEIPRRLRTHSALGRGGHPVAVPPVGDRHRC